MKAVRTEGSSDRAEETRPPGAAGRAEAWWMVGLFLLYVALQLIFRVATSDSAELDESEQLILAQHFQWGYGNQPPLYTWLQMLAFAACGTNVFALALLKSLLIFAILAFTYFTVLEITGEGRVALAGTASLFLLPHFAWEARRDLSHTVLAMAMVAGALYFGVRMLKARRAWDYAGFGLSAGLGLLGKYNYLFFLVAFLAAAWSAKHFRSALGNKKMLLSGVLFFAVTWAHLNWLSAHGPVLRAGAGKLRAAHASGLVGAWAGGFGSLVAEGLAVTVILGLVYFGFFFRAPVISAEKERGVEMRPLLRRTLTVGMVLCMAMIFCFQVRFKARWLLPLLMITPVYLTLLVQPRMDAVRTRNIFWIGGSAAIIALIALPAAAPLASLTGKYTRLNAPYAALAAELKRIGIEPGVIVAENRMIGGNLKLFFKSSAVVVPELMSPPIPDQAAWLVIWDATKKAEIPRAVAEFSNRIRNPPLAEIGPRYVESRLKYSKDKFMKLGFLTLREDR